VKEGKGAKRRRRSTKERVEDARPKKGSGFGSVEEVGTGERS